MAPFAGVFGTRPTAHRQLRGDCVEGSGAQDAENTGAREHVASLLEGRAPGQVQWAMALPPSLPSDVGHLHFSIFAYLPYFQ